MSGIEDIPAGVDTTRASVARVYDYLLGGKDHFEVDRIQGEQLAQALPDVATIARENRAFLTRIVRYLVNHTGITQYLDIGSGLPTAENTHNIVQRSNPDSTVVYVDNDPAVLAHGRALMADNDHTHIVDGDIWDPPSILTNPTVRAHLDFAEPIAFICMATLHQYKGDDREFPARVMHDYIDKLAAGSYVALSHLYDPEDPDDTAVMRKIEDAARTGSLGGGGARTHHEIAALFEGTVLLDPGIVETWRWYPAGPRDPDTLTAAHRLVAGGLARKP